MKKSPSKPLWMLRNSRTVSGSLQAAAASMPHEAVVALIEECNRRGCCIAVAFADHWAKHHGGKE